MAMNEGGFGRAVMAGLRSKLHSRFIPYAVYIFDNAHVSINVHVTGAAMSITIPFIMYKDGKEVVLLFRDKEIRGKSISSVISYIGGAVQREQSKTRRIKTEGN